MRPQRGNTYKPCPGADSMCDGGIAARVVGFGVFLKSHGFRSFQNSIEDAIQSLRTVGITNKEDFFYALRANLVKSDLEWEQFRRLFDQYWAVNNNEMESGKDDETNQGTKEAPHKRTREQRRNQNLQEITTELADGGKEIKQIWMKGQGYSPVSDIDHVDLNEFDKNDILAAKLGLKRIISSFKTKKSRRTKRSPHKQARIDFPRIIRKSFRSEGIPMDFFYREKRKRLKRLVIIADVSGSMDRYARFVIPFLLGLRGVGPKAEVFVFSTKLTHVTSIIRHLSIEKALERLAKEVPEWSGGTRIGYSLHQFNQNYGISLLSNRTVILILSDGWDLGGKLMLRKEMEHISQKAHSVLWLNPLAGDPDYRPLYKGVQVVLPYVDYLLPANSLEGLKRVGKVLSHLMIH